MGKMVAWEHVGAGTEVLAMFLFPVIPQLNSCLADWTAWAAVTEKQEEAKYDASFV